MSYFLMSEGTFSKISITASLHPSWSCRYFIETAKTSWQYRLKRISTHAGLPVALNSATSCSSVLVFFAVDLIKVRNVVVNEITECCRRKRVSNENHSTYRISRSFKTFPTFALLFCGRGEIGRRTRL